MIHLVMRELGPEYLTLITEPDTLVRLTGLQSFAEPQSLVELVGATLAGLDHHNTQICAGAGSWNGVPYAEAIARNTGVDAVCIHIYPITGDILANAAQMARIARANGKRAIIDEAWLYKTTMPGGGDHVAAAEQTFGLDVYGFGSHSTSSSSRR